MTVTDVTALTDLRDQLVDMLAYTDTTVFDVEQRRIDAPKLQARVTMLALQARIIADDLTTLALDGAS